MNSQLIAMAENLRRRHIVGDPLLVPNAWDVSSTRAVVRAGYPAVATSAGARLAARGIAGPEGSDTADEAFALWACMAQAAGVALSVEIEPAYDLGPEEWAERLIDAGVAGATVAVHAGGGHPGREADLVARLRRTASAMGVPLVINARIDADGQVGAQARLHDAVGRALACLGAGADCVFPADLRHEDEIAAFVRAVRAPVSVRLSAGGPTIGRLAALGVRRVGFGAERRPQAFLTAPAVRRAG